MKFYYGYANENAPGPCKVTVREEGKRQRPLRKRLDLFSHSPDGFAWGYGGSGPAQLALAILAENIDDDIKAVRLHQEFKWKVIAKLDGDRNWMLPGIIIDAFCNIGGMGELVVADDHYHWKEK